MTLHLHVINEWIFKDSFSVVLEKILIAMVIPERSQFKTVLVKEEGEGEKGEDNGGGGEKKRTDSVTVKS